MLQETLPSRVPEGTPSPAAEGDARQTMRPLYAVSALTPGLLYYALAQQTALAPAAMLLLSAASAPALFLLLRPLARRLPELEDSPRLD